MFQLGLSLPFLKIFSPQYRVKYAPTSPVKRPRHSRPKQSADPCSGPMWEVLLPDRRYVEVRARTKSEARGFAKDLLVRDELLRPGDRLPVGTRVRRVHESK